MLIIDQCIELCFVHVITAAPAPPTRRPSVGTGYYLVMVRIAYCRENVFCFLMYLQFLSLHTPSLVSQARPFSLHSADYFQYHVPIVKDISAVERKGSGL